MATQPFQKFKTIPSYPTLGAGSSSGPTVRLSLRHTVAAATCGIAKLCSAFALGAEPGAFKVPPVGTKFRYTDFLLQITQV